MQGWGPVKRAIRRFVIAIQRNEIQFSLGYLAPFLAGFSQILVAFSSHVGFLPEDCQEDERLGILFVGDVPVEEYCGEAMLPLMWEAYELHENLPDVQSLGEFEGFKERVEETLEKAGEAETLSGTLEKLEKKIQSKRGELGGIAGQVNRLRRER